MATASFNSHGTPIVISGRRFVDTVTHHRWEGLGSTMRFAIKGNSLKIVHNCQNTAGLEISVDSGAFSVVTTTNVSSRASPQTSANILPGSPTDDWHDIELRLSNGYSALFWMVMTNGLIVDGADPQIRAHSNAPDFANTYRTTDAIFSHNYLANSAVSNNYPSADDWLIPGGRMDSASASELASNGYVRWRGNGTRVHYFGKTDANNFVRLYVDGCQYGDRKALTGVAGSATTPGYQWGFLDLPNDGQDHEYILVHQGGLDWVGVQNATSMAASIYANDFRAMFVGHSLVAGTAAPGAAEASSNYDVLCLIASDAANSPTKLLNRGKSGASYSSYISEGLVASTVTPFGAKVIFIDLGHNDTTAAGVTSPDSRDPLTAGTLAANMVTVYNSILNGSPNAMVWQLEPIQDTTTNRTRLIECMDAAIANVNNPRLGKITADAGWDNSAGVTNSIHGYPAAMAETGGNNCGAVLLTAQPSGGDTFTVTAVGGTVYTFTYNAGSHGASPNPITIGAAVADTILNTFNVMVSVLGRSGVLSYSVLPSASPVQYTVQLRRVTALAKSGTNLAVYKNSIAGTGGHQDKWLSKVAARKAMYHPSANDQGNRQASNARWGTWTNPGNGMTYADNNTATIVFDDTTGVSAAGLSENLQFTGYGLPALPSGQQLASVTVTLRVRFVSTTLNPLFLVKLQFCSGSSVIGTVLNPALATDDGGGVVGVKYTGETDIAVTVTDRTILDAIGAVMDEATFGLDVECSGLSSSTSRHTGTLHVNGAVISGIETEDAPASGAGRLSRHRRIISAVASAY